MKTHPHLIILALALLIMGCSHFSVTQLETQDGTRTTRTSAFTLLDSKSEIAKVRASTTDKSQSTSVGSIAQESSGSNVLRIVVEGAAAAGGLVR
jgi:PBP1b-binding outer membrane lipoprotein LpoB